MQFMAWERSFEAKIMAIRKKELSWQKRNYLVEVSRLLLRLETILRSADVSSFAP